jgi:hypothetical protein
MKYGKSKAALTYELRKYESHIKDLVVAHKKGWRTYLGDKLNMRIIDEHIRDYAKLRVERYGTLYKDELRKAYVKFLG